MSTKTSRRAALQQLAVAALGARAAACAATASAPGDDASTDAGNDAGHDAGPDERADDASAAEDSPASVVEGGAPSPLDPASLVEAPASFALGALAGDATAQGFVACARFERYEGFEPGLVVVELDDARRPRRTVYDAPVRPDGDGFARVELAGLEPGARHRYAFVLRREGAPVARSRVGHVRTALADDALATVRFGGTSCTKQSYRPFPALAHAAARDDLDFFLHGGDHVYCDGARTRADFRAKYRENFTDPTLAALHASAGGYNTWDDHEFDNNFDPETFDASVRREAVEAFFEHLPVRRDPTNPARLWRSFRWGRTLELFVLDARTERRPSTRRGPDATYLSAQQLAWLRDGLARSSAVFKLVLNAVPIADFGLAFSIGATDNRWEGYAAQRTALLDAVAALPPGVVFLSGDFHLGAFGRVARSGPHAAVPEVLMGAGGQFGNPLAATLTAPQWDFATAENNYVAFEADPVARTLRAAFFAREGRVLFDRALRV